MVESVTVDGEEISVDELSDDTREELDESVSEPDAWVVMYDGITEAYFPLENDFRVEDNGSDVLVVYYNNSSSNGGWENDDSEYDYGFYCQRIKTTREKPADE